MTVVLQVVIEVLEDIEARGVDVACLFEGLAPFLYLGAGTVFEF